MNLVIKTVIMNLQYTRRWFEINGLDRIIIRERRRRYKRLIKLRKARDMSKKYRKTVIKLTTVDKGVGMNEHEIKPISHLAKKILDHEIRFKAK